MARPAPNKKRDGGSACTHTGVNVKARATKSVGHRQARHCTNRPAGSELNNAA